MITDINVSLGPWPFQEFSIKSAHELAQHLKKEGIDKAYVRSCRAAFLTDPANNNKHLNDDLAPYPQLIPVPTINPLIKNWHRTFNLEELRAVNIYPEFIPCKLDNREISEAAEMLIAADTILFITIRMEDPRSMHPRCIIPAVPPEDINAFAKKFPALKIICLNCSVGEPEIITKNAPNVYVDIAYYELCDTMKNLSKKVPEDQILFGSHTPFFYTRAALMKLRGSSVMHNYESILQRNASELSL
jgi:hypothetical protein